MKEDAYNGNEDFFKYNPLNKRTQPKCPFSAFAQAKFTGKVNGLMTFAQKSCNTTIISGIFANGLVDPKNNCYSIRIQDVNGKLRDITKDLKLKFIKDGTEPFSVEIKNFNLNCDNGILTVDESEKQYYSEKQTYSEKQVHSEKQTYSGKQSYSAHSYSKKHAHSEKQSYVRKRDVTAECCIFQGEKSYVQAPIA
ncbi:19293_t:CDS:2, partial [Gigaspora margarita]